MEYFAFQWHITEACDQRCRHCYIYALGSHAKFQEMALEDMVTVLENCKTFCQKAGRLPYLYITGGDPILHPQFWALMKLLKLSNIPFALMGNPFHLTADVCRRLKDCGCRKYQLSLDGLRETHDGIRQQPGSYDTTMAAIPLLRGAGIDVAIMTTVSRWNYRDGHACAPRGAGKVAGFDFCGAALSLQRIPWGDSEHRHGVLHPGHGHRVLPPGGEPHLPGELHRRPRTGKAQGLHHYRGLHQLRRLCGSLPPAGRHLGRAQRHPPGALPPLRQLRGALPRGGRYTKGAGDRPSGNLTQGSCGLLAEEGFFFGSVNRKSIFLARPIYGFHWNMF